MVAVAVINNFKQCNKCKKFLDRSLFNVNNAAKDKLQYRCRECDNEYQRSKPRNLSWEKEYRKKKSKDLEWRMKQLWNTAKARAKQKNREFLISLEDLLDIYPKDGKCPIYGFELEWNSGGFRETSPSIDRIDSTKGYTKDNIQIISWKANRIKGYASVEDLEILLAYMKQGD